MHRMATVLCTSGLAAEAKIARAAGFPVVIGAGDRERTAALVESAVQHAKCLMSFGIAGALAPHLRPGDVVISAEVVSAGHRWAAADLFQSRVADLARQIGAFEGTVLGAPTILATEEEKRRAWRETGALAVDLRSFSVARGRSRAANRCLRRHSPRRTHHSCNRGRETPCLARDGRPCRRPQIFFSRAWPISRGKSVPSKAQSSAHPPFLQPR